MEQREEKLQRWFQMWLQGKDLGIAEIFSDDCVYLESWGPEYRGREKIAHWFQEWNTRGKVTCWEICQFFHEGDQTVVEWSFRNEMKTGNVEEFHGLSLVRWDLDGRIAFLREFGSNIHNYDPYGQGDSPVFRGGPPVWF